MELVKEQIKEASGLRRFLLRVGEGPWYGMVR